jgi:hypothetical protein
MSNTKQPKVRLVAHDDIAFWISVGCVAPSVEQLRRVQTAVKKVMMKASCKETFIYWMPDGTFEVQNKKRDLTQPEKKK